jgi:hypothetical protein
MCVYVYYTSIVVQVVSMETHIMCVCVCMYEYYTVILVPGNPLHSYHGNWMNVCVRIMYFHSGTHS